MSTPGTILELPSLRAAESLARHCLALRAIGVINGPNGTGKTQALKALARHNSLLPPERICHYYTAAQAEGSSRGVRDLLIDLEVRQAIHQRGLALPIALRLSLREFVDRKIDLILVDEADLLSSDALRGMVSMFDYASLKGHPIGMMLAGVKPIDKWIKALPDGWSRTLKVSRLTNLSVELTCATFAGWGSPMAELAGKVKQKDRDAVQLIRAIHRGTGGNLRRLFYFAGLAALDPRPLDAARLRQLMDQMTTIPTGDDE